MGGGAGAPQWEDFGVLMVRGDTGVHCIPSPKPVSTKEGPWLEQIKLGRVAGRSLAAGIPLQMGHLHKIIPKSLLLLFSVGQRLSQGGHSHHSPRARVPPPGCGTFIRGRKQLGALVKKNNQNNIKTPTYKGFLAQGCRMRPRGCGGRL